MQRTLLFKILAILGLTLLICIPLFMIQNTIAERTQFRRAVVDSIAADSVRAQTIAGPVLVIRYTDEFDEQIEVAEGLGKRKENVVRSVRRKFLVFPNDLVVDSDIKTGRRYRGIHQVLVYDGQHRIGGNFLLPVLNDLPRASPGSRIRLGQPSVVLGVGDVRGIRNIPQIDWNGEQIEFQQGTDLAAFDTGLHAKLKPMTLEQPASVVFSMKLGLDGIERQSFVPVGKNNKVTVQSDWPHPQFTGHFLPSASDRTVDQNGFSATWQVSSLSTTAQKRIRDQEGSALPSASHPVVESFSIGFIEPVNVYSLAERATKYGLLFIALTFAAFFMFEIVKQLPIHPVQYTLVGLALVLFFLLLVSLSEHVAFVLAYLIASAACIALLGFYLSFVLRSWARGVTFAMGLTALYGALYGLLISESNALVLGSILLFAMLSAVMVATRKIDWYSIGKPASVLA